MWSSVVILSLLFFASGIQKLPVIDRDEAHFAQASRQMLQSGNFFQIRFQDRTRFQKPPGINWLQAGSVKLFSGADSNHIWPYRIPSLLGALFAVLATLYLGTRLLTERIGFIASLFLASSLLLVAEAHMGVIDAALLASVVLMQAALWIVYQASANKVRVNYLWPLCFWLAMAAGLVLKGVTPLVGLLSITALCIIDRDLRWLRNLWPFTGLALLLSLSLIWVILVNEAEHSNYLMQMIHKDLLPKLKGGHESHGKPPLFHLAILPLTFWPASLFLWPAGVYAFRHRKETAVKFLLAWIIPTWAFFELMPTKLPQYILPVFPALALLSAMAVESLLNGEFLRGSRWLKFLQGMWGVLSLGFAVFILVISYVLLNRPSWSATFLLSAVFILTAITLFFVFRYSYYRAVAALMVMATVVYCLSFNQILPRLDPLWITPKIAALASEYSLSAENPLVAVGFDEPSLVFNLNTDWVRFADSNEALAFMQRNAQQLVLIDDKTFAGWQIPYDRFAVIARVHGFNYSKGRWLNLFLVGPKNNESN
ncbi:melitin resistance protein [Legionella birminghamensis]|uniref:Melitin resistance protein n=1 Tax=Legionella birminghamensis TaxID=28083 RepID=A0A378IAM9_9GAMM|nr:glycosyltransferase family 39 protein [Legionella birminghamensis]KTC76078.1 melitin resistance protein [Legionella birminghamensis]STX32298.1 melitin resistance protein [Legionella birminghamensis]